MRAKNLFLYPIGFLLSVLIAILLYRAGIFHDIASMLDGNGYMGAIVGGVMYSSTFTTALASGLFLELGKTHHPLFIAILGGMGAMLGDVLFYWIFNDGIKREAGMLGGHAVSPSRRRRWERFLKRRAIVWIVPLIAGILIASPLPDELGIALFSMINFKPKYFSGISFLLNAVGIFFLAVIGQTIG